MKLFLLFLSLTVICLSASNQPFDILKGLFEANNLKYTQSIENCFDQTQKESIVAWLNTTKLLSPESIVISTYVQRFYETLSNETRHCLQHHNDVQILLYKFGNSFGKINEKLTLLMSTREPIYQLNIKLIFSFLANGDYEGLGNYLSDIGHQLFGQTAEDPWIKRVDNVETLTKYYGVSVGNGAIGLVSSKQPYTVKDSVLAGAYDKYGRGRVDNIITTFNGIDLDIELNGKRFSEVNFVQQLNMKDGSFKGSFTSTSFSSSYEYYALKTLPFASLIKITITPTANSVLKVTSNLQALDYMHNIEQYFENLQASGDSILSILTSKASSSTGKLQLFTSTMFLFQSGIIPPHIYHVIWDSNRHYNVFQQQIKKGQSFTFALVTCSLANNLHPDPYNQAIRVLIRANSLGIDTLISKHKIQWNKQWASADIIIEGNDSDQKDVRMMLYHLYSFINPNAHFGLSPMGLSGTGYNGHVFWDMDLWMYPGILAIDPDLGESLVEYRYQRLDQAVANAYINGYKGAMYPWESASQGTEQTPVWALTGPLEHHITGCVAFAAWNYYAVTQNKEWLAQKGYKILVKAAEFWQSRVEQQKGEYHIKNVVAADQWAEYVDDDAFTNAVAKQTLRIANKAKQVLGYTVNPLWEQIANKIPILKIQTYNVTKQHSKYNGEAIKQADVNLLSFPLKQVTDKSQILRDLQYYQDKIPQQGTPAMTYSIFTILYSRLKDATNAYKYFKQSYQPYSLPPFGVFAETKGGNNPYFLTGAGGVIQSLVYGFGGLDISDEGLRIVESVIPKQWKSVTIKTKANIITQKAIKSKTGSIYTNRQTDSPNQFEVVNKLKEQSV